MKIMVYINDVSEDTGALRSHGLKSSREIYMKGYFNRKEYDKFKVYLEDKSKYKIFEGKAGTALIFDNNLLHRGFPPKRHHRDVVVFSILPSTEPWQKHAKRMGKKLSYDPVKRSAPPYNPAKD